MKIRNALYHPLMLLLLLAPSPAQSQSLKRYQSAFNGVLHNWAKSFSQFKLTNFKQISSGKFENKNTVQAKSLQVFYPDYKPALSISPNGRYVLDIYSYRLLEKKQGRFVTAGTDVEQSILLGNIPAKKWVQIAYYGYTQRAQEVYWVDNDTFILAAARINKAGRNVPVITIGHIGQQSLAVFESTNANCYQRASGYTSPKFAALKIRPANHQQ